MLRKRTSNHATSQIRLLRTWTRLWTPHWTWTATLPAGNSIAIVNSSVRHIIKPLLPLVILSRVGRNHHLSITQTLTRCKSTNISSLILSFFSLKTIIFLCQCQHHQAVSIPRFDLLSHRWRWKRGRMGVSWRCEATWHCFVRPPVYAEETKVRMNTSLPLFTD